MEELNKTQVVLLTLFITFVTSVTTGIVTVTLLQQAPPGVTQTINRVVEHTIEKITPVTTKTETRIVGQEDQIIQTAAAIKPSIVRILLSAGAVSQNSSSPNATSSDQIAAIAAADLGQNNEIGTGFVVSSDGLVATSYSVIPDQSANYDVYVGDKKYQATVVVYNKNEGVAILKIAHDKSVKFFAPPFNPNSVMLGQTVVVLGRDLERYTVSVGLVSSLKPATASSLPSFKTTVRTDGTNIGGPLLSSDGYLIGLNLEGGSSLPVELLRSVIAGNASTTKAVN